MDRRTLLVLLLQSEGNEQVPKTAVARPLKAGSKRESIFFKRSVTGCQHCATVSALLSPDSDRGLPVSDHCSRVWRQKEVKPIAQHNMLTGDKFVHHLYTVYGLGKCRKKY